MRNGAMLGQVPIREGSGFQPGSWLWPGSFGQFPAPSTAARQINTQSELSEEPRCYSCEDGTFRFLTAAEVEASGLSCSRVNPQNCAAQAPGRPALISMGQDEEPAPPPGDGGDGNGDDRDFRFFFPPFQQFPYPPYAPPHGRGKLICKRDEDRSEDAGEDVFVCEREEPEGPPVVYGPRYPIFFMRPFGF